MSVQQLFAPVSGGSLTIANGGTFGGTVVANEWDAKTSKDQTFTAYAATNQLVLGGTTNPATTNAITITAPAPVSGNLTYTIPDAGGSTSFVTTSSTAGQTITGPFTVNSSGSATTNVGTGTYSGAIGIGNTSAGVIQMDSSAAQGFNIGTLTACGINIGSNANNSTTTLLGNVNIDIAGNKPINIGTGSYTGTCTIGNASGGTINMSGFLSFPTNPTPPTTFTGIYNQLGQGITIGSSAHLLLQTSVAGVMTNALTIDNTPLVTVTGALTVAPGTSSAAISLGSGSNYTGTINIAATSAGAGTIVNIGNANAGSQVFIAGAIKLNSGTSNQNIDIGNSGTYSGTITIGSSTTNAVNIVTSASGCTINGGTSNPINLGTGTYTSTVHIADGSGASTVNIGNASSTTNILGAFTNTSGTPVSGTWTGPTTSPSQTITFIKFGQIVHAKFPAVGTTANTVSTTGTWGGTVPAAYRPAATNVMPNYVTNNGNTVAGTIQVTSAGAITVSVDGASNAFTAFTAGSGLWSPTAFDITLSWVTV